MQAWEDFRIAQIQAAVADEIDGRRQADPTALL